MATESATGPALDEFKRTQRRVWAAGNYGELSPFIADVGERLVERAGVRAGSRVLDVACGTGNAALPAARAGARVTGVDLVPELLAAGRATAGAAGAEIDFVHGDAEELPFEDGSFDFVLSTFGHMFAPRHRRVADEMARVCRARGVIGTCTWTPEGVTGAVFAASAAFMPPPPDFASPPILWGTEDHVREMFAAARGFEFERHLNLIECESIDGFADFFMDRFGPLVTARSMVGERFGELRARIVSIWSDANLADAPRLRLPQEYLLSLIRM